VTGMETERARGKCIAKALVCQLCWTFLLELATRHLESANAMVEIASRDL